MVLVLAPGCVFESSPPQRPDASMPDMSMSVTDAGADMTTIPPDLADCECDPAEHAAGVCIDGACVYTCESGWLDLDEAAGCETEVEDLPGDGEDSNGDGVDGVLELSVYVAADGAVDGTGLSPDSPVGDMWRALEIAQTNARPHILIRAGALDGGWTVRNGRTLVGGYDDDFVGISERTVVTRPETPPAGVDAFGVHAVRVRSASAVTFINLDFHTQSFDRGEAAPMTVFVEDSPNVTFARSAIYGATAAPGLHGSDAAGGADGRAGPVGSVRDPFSSEPTRIYGGAGAYQDDCGTGSEGHGGAGGDGLACPASGGTDGEDAPGGGLGGQGGASACSGGTPDNGLDGADGLPGAGAVSVPLEAGPGTFFGQWMPAPAANGVSGTMGAGGGGGGAGGATIGVNPGFGGAGGGSAGCGGPGGMAGESGFASFAVFVQRATVHFIDSEVVLGTGGDGGTGGQGGCGGAGGPGGAGEAPDVFGGGSGGGGNGGDGGNGSGGQGGHGGPVFGVAGVQMSVDAPDGTFSGGEPGRGGAGGLANVGCDSDPRTAAVRGEEGSPGERHELYDFAL